MNYPYVFYDYRGPFCFRFSRIEFERIDVRRVYCERIEVSKINAFGNDILKMSLEIFVSRPLN